jgi:serine/threonine-protein kinase HipA
MSQCPITYEICSPDKYSSAGLKKLRRGLTKIELLDETAIQGHPATNFEINWTHPWAFGEIPTGDEQMEIRSKKSRFILLPPAKPIPQTSENIDLSTRLAEICGIKPAFHGMLFNKDQTLTYFAEIPRDISRNKSLSLTKSTDALKSLKKPLNIGTVEGLVEVIENYCTFPVIEKYRLFQRILFSWLTGYESQSWKDYFLLKQASKTALAPPLFFINSILLYGRQEREMGLSVRGKYTAFTAEDFKDLLGREILLLSKEAIDHIFLHFKSSYSPARQLVLNSFLSEELKEHFLDVLVGRFSRLRL